MRTVASRIASQLQEPVIHNGYSRLTGVSITAPTSPTNVGGNIPHLAGAPKIFSALQVTPACDASISCEFGGDVRHASATSKFPSQFWAVADHNAYVACETEVTYDALADIANLGLRRKVKGKASIRAEVRGARPNKRGGVFFGIAPYQEFYPWQKRFEFPITKFPAQNPLEVTDHSPNPTAGNLAFVIERAELNDNTHSNIFAATAALRSDKRYSKNVVTETYEWVDWDDANGAGGETYSERDSMLLQKYNLATAARNHVLAGLATLLSKHSDTIRSSYVIVGPKNQDGSDTPGIFS